MDVSGTLTVIKCLVVDARVSEDKFIEPAATMAGRRQKINHMAAVACIIVVEETVVALKQRSNRRDEGRAWK
jgi:hypothetical protein